MASITFTKVASSSFTVPKTSYKLIEAAPSDMYAVISRSVWRLVVFQYKRRNIKVVGIVNVLCFLYTAVVVQTNPEVHCRPAR